MDNEQQTDLSVSELSASLKMVVEGAFSYVRVKGEISGFKRAPSGHIYFSLKDDKAVISAVCWSGVSSRFNFKPENGMEVICSGKITTFAGQSKYQIVVNFMQAAGVGALMELLEKRKKTLAAEGLFDADRKRELPFLPNKIGVITSPTGAVIRDIIHRISDRFPVNIVLWPVLVQGEKASEQITNAIEGFNNLNKDERPDVIIIARGGGSIEDLWAFNEDNVVRAVADSEIITISAVGHETDTTLIDYASDLRAPTPTAAAEMAVPVRAELIGLLDDLERRKKSAILRLLDYKKQILAGLKRGLLNPENLINEKQQVLDNLVIRMNNAVPNIIKSSEQRLQFVSKMLDSLNYKSVLKRGFSITKNSDGKLIKNAASLNAGDMLNIEFFDGEKQAIVSTSPKPRRQRKIKTSKEQGSLF